MLTGGTHYSNLEIQVKVNRPSACVYLQAAKTFLHTMSLNEIPPTSDAFSDKVREELAKSKDEVSFIHRYKEELSAVSEKYFRLSRFLTV